MLVKIPRILEHCNPMNQAPWPGVDIITIEDVLTRVFSPLPLNSDPFTGQTWGKDQHIARIAYFVDRGWSTPIQIDVGCPSFPGFRYKWLVDDGNHRLCAAIVRGDRYIDADISGERKYATELLGVVWED